MRHKVMCRAASLPTSQWHLIDSFHRIATTATMTFRVLLHEVVQFKLHAVCLAKLRRAYGGGHARVSIGFVVDSDDPLLHQWLVHFHVDGQTLQGLTELNLVDLALRSALTLQFLEACLAEDDLVQGQDCREDV